MEQLFGTPQKAQKIANLEYSNFLGSPTPATPKKLATPKFSKISARII